MAGVVASLNGRNGVVNIQSSDLDNLTPNLGATTVSAALTADSMTVSGNVSIGSSSLGQGAAPLIISADNQAVLFEPNSAVGSYNPITESGDVLLAGVGSTGGSLNAFTLAPWSGIKGGIRLLPSGEVQTANNILDDGSGNATIAGSASITGNASISAALTANTIQALASTSTAVPTGASTAQSLADMFAQLATANVKAFGATGNGTTDDSPAIINAINYLLSIGGGTLFFPAGNYIYDTQENYFGIKNIRISGEGAGSIISLPANSGFNMWGSGSSYSIVSAASTSTQIIFDGVYSGVSVGDYAYFTGGSQNITVTAISGNTITFSSSVNVISGATVLFAHPYIEDLNVIIENIYFQGTGSDAYMELHYGSNVLIQKCIFSGVESQVNLDRCPNHIIRDCIFKGNTAFLSGGINVFDYVWQSGNAQGPMGGPGYIVRPMFMPSFANDTTPNLFLGSGSYAIIIKNAPNEHVDGLVIDNGAWGVASGTPANAILISGISQGVTVQNCYATMINNFVTLAAASGSSPSYIKLIDNSVDVFSGIVMYAASGNTYEDIEVRNNSFDNPMFAPTAVSVSAGGSGFSVGDVLEIGTAQAGSEAFVAQVTVTTVSSGAITGLDITNSGLYAFTSPPSNPVTLYSGGSATNASVDVTWSAQPFMGYINTTKRVIWSGNKMFAYGGYNPAYGVVCYDCENVTVDNNTAELLLQPFGFTGCTNWMFRSNLVAGTSPPLSGSVPSGSYGIVVNGGGSDPVSEGGLISDNSISGVNYALYGNDNSGNSTGILYLNVMPTNAMPNITNSSQFVNGLTLSATNVLSYNEAWNPIAFQNILIANGEVNLAGQTTIGGALSVEGTTDFINPITVNGQTIGASPLYESITTPVSGTAYQWTGASELKLVVSYTMNPGGSSSSSVWVGIGSTSTTATSVIWADGLPTGTISGQSRTAVVPIPPGYWYQVTANNVTIDSASGWIM